jgi:hypothetical protein
LAEPGRPLLALHSDRFNAHDFDPIRDTLAEEVRLELVIDAGWTVAMKCPGIFKMGDAHRKGSERDQHFLLGISRRAMLWQCELTHHSEGTTEA